MNQHNYIFVRIQIDIIFMSFLIMGILILIIIKEFTVVDIIRDR